MHHESTSRCCHIMACCLFWVSVCHYSHFSGHKVGLPLFASVGRIEMNQGLKKILPTSHFSYMYSPKIEGLVSKMYERIV